MGRKKLRIGLADAAASQRTLEADTPRHLGNARETAGPRETTRSTRDRSLSCFSRKAAVWTPADTSATYVRRSERPPTPGVMLRDDEPHRLR